MKSIRALAVSTALFVLLAGLAACADNTGDTGDSSGQPSSQQAGEEKAEAPQVATVEQVIEAPDTGADVDSLIGSWIDITSEDRFVNITKNGDEYQYEDNEGILPATFQDGVLKLKVSDTETADVYINPENGYLTLVYLDNISEFKKK